MSQFVEGPYTQRGGLWFVAEPGQLKTTAIQTLEEYDKALLVCNLTVKSLNAMRGTFLSGSLKTLGISDLEQIYRRHSSVSAQLEGIIMSLVEEGYRTPGFLDQRIQATPARVAIVGGMSSTFFDKMQSNWLDCGFYRRFLWSRYSLQDSTLLEDAISQWRKAELDGSFSMKKMPVSRTIRMNLNEKEIEEIRHSLRFHLDCKTPFVLAMKICSVLKWKFNRGERHMNIWRDFAESLSKEGAQLDLSMKKEKQNGKVS